MDKALLRVDELKKTYRRGMAEVDAVRGVSIEVAESEIFGIVGESGSGKSTLLRLIAGMETASSGSIIFDNEDIRGLSVSGYHTLYRKLQMVFQSPATSFDPRMTIRRSIYEPLRNLCGIRTERELNERACELFDMVGLDPALLDRYSFEISGGQCQRAAIARAVSVRPKLLLCDEATSALDVTAQANVVELLCNLSRNLNMGILFVSHDIALVSNICRRSIVMRRGVCEECGLTKDLIGDPKTDYTKQLISSATMAI